MENFFVPSCSQELTNFAWLPMQFETHTRLLSVSAGALNAHVILTFSSPKRINGHFHNLVEKRHQFTSHVASALEAAGVCTTTVRHRASQQRPERQLHVHHHALLEAFPPTSFRFLPKSASI